MGGGDESNRIAANFPRPGRDIMVRFSNSPPDKPYLAVSTAGGGSCDYPTKRYFKLMTSLWTAVVADSIGANNSQAPVLTLHISR